MRQMSAAQLQRDFLRAFFATLCVRGQEWVTWGSPETDRSFRRVADYLLHDAKPGSPLKRLAALLRPDPVSGIVTAVSDSITYLQPGIVSIPNPSYRRIKLVATQGLAVALKQELPPDIAEVLDGAVEVFRKAQAGEAGEAHARTNTGCLKPT